ncbi:MAG: autotransporter outer membrane beta-barrel domain-containing protein [Desulfovibrionaceae bacterium]|nr:autotransporter outer membrane beta-barrel domain-containing protein [Desulfovibrionaceae bacterium]
MEVADLVFTIEDLGYIKIIGGEADNNSASGTCLAEANGNTYILNGGTYSGTIYAGYASLTNADSGTAEASNNRVELRNGSSGAPDLTNASICVAKASANNANVTLKSTGNSLNFYDVKGMTAKSISGFQSLNYEYSEMVAGDVILTVTGTDDEKTTSIAKTDVSVSVVNLYGKNSGEFKIGDKVVLLKNDNGLDTTDIKTKAVITAETGISLTYEVEIQTNDDGTELFLTRTGTNDRGDKDGTTVNPGTKAIAEGAAAGLALVNESANASIEFLRDFSVSGGSITPFVYVQGSSMRHETGSSINMSAVSLMAGLGTGIETGAGTLSAGAFFEYGKGSYTTHNSFSNYSDVDGDGNSWYMGAGILAKMDFVPTGPGHFYLEGSAHMGTLHNEYDSNDLYDANGNVAKFDMDSPYYSLHGGLGYVWNMAEGHDLDVYGKYIWTRVQGTDDTLTTKDKFEYDDMDSNRVRFGVRYTYKGSERFVPYVGAAFEHEFSGSCDSKAYGHSVAAPSFKGSSGMGELGLMMKPTEELPLSINLGVQGYVGQKQGVSGNCNIMYEF